VQARGKPGPQGGALILLPGRDPARRSGGGESYGLAQALAATHAGYAPQLFTIGRRSALFETAFGVVDRVSMPVPSRSMFACVQRPWFVRAVVDFLRGRPGPHVIHGFGGWADTAVASARALERAGVEAVAVTTLYAPQEHEALGKLADPIIRRDPLQRARHELELRFIRYVSAPVEDAPCARRASSLSTTNRCARSRSAYGDGLPVRRLPHVAPTAFRDHLETAQPKQRRRPQHGARRQRDGISQMLCGILRRARAGRRADDPDQRSERRVLEQTPSPELLLQEPVGVVARRERDRPRARRERLHQNPAARLPTSGAARQLSDQREGALLRTKVGKPQRLIGVEHDAQRDVRKVVALGDHLRPDQHAGVGCLERRQRLRGAVLRRRRIGIEPEDRKAGAAAQATPARDTITGARMASPQTLIDLGSS
jgi:hypothetical protein